MGKIGKVRKISRSKRLILTFALGKKSPDTPLKVIITEPAHCCKVIKFHSFTFSRTQTSCDDGNVVHLKKYFKIFCATQLSPIVSHLKYFLLSIRIQFSWQQICSYPEDSSWPATQTARYYAVI